MFRFHGIGPFSDIIDIKSSQIVALFLPILDVLVILYNTCVALLFFAHCAFSLELANLHILLDLIRQTRYLFR